MTKNKSTEFKVNCMQPYKEQGGKLGPSVLITWQKEGDQSNRNDSNKDDPNELMRHGQIATAARI